MSLHVVLTDQQIARAREIAAVRDANGRAHGYRPKLGPGTDRAHLIGALGEMAVAVQYGAEWIDPERLDRKRHHLPDVGGVDVRASENPRALLPIRPHDPADRTHVLVIVGPAPGCRIAGWINGAAARRPEWWREADHRGAGWWAVPQDALLDPVALVIRQMEGAR